MRVYVNTHGGQKRVSDLVEFQLLEIAGCPELVLGTLPASSARMGGTLNHWAVSPAPYSFL